MEPVKLRKGDVFFLTVSSYQASKFVLSHSLLLASFDKLRSLQFKYFIRSNVRDTEIGLCSLAVLFSE